MKLNNSGVFQPYIPYWYLTICLKWNLHHKLVYLCSFYSLKGKYSFFFSFSFFENTYYTAIHVHNLNSYVVFSGKQPLAFRLYGRVVVHKKHIYKTSTPGGPEFWGWQRRNFPENFRMLTIKTAINTFLFPLLINIFIPTMYRCIRYNRLARMSVFYLSSRLSSETK